MNDRSTLVRNSKNLSVYIDPRLDDRVRIRCKKFVKWIRKQYTYPIKLYIALLNLNSVADRNNERCAATIFFPYPPLSPNDYAHMRVAAKCHFSNDPNHNTQEMASLLSTIAYHVGGYFYWLDHLEEKTVDGLEEDRFAKQFSADVLGDYWYVTYGRIVK